MTTSTHERINMLRDLQPGWWGPRSEVPDPTLFDDLESIETFLDNHKTLVAFAVDGDGDINFEWETGEGEGLRFHVLVYDTERIWSFSWTDEEGDTGIEQTFTPYSIATVEEAIKRSLTV